MPQLQQQNDKLMNSSEHLPITTNENEFKRPDGRDLDDRDTGDIENQKGILPTTTATPTLTKRKQFNDRANSILQNGIDKCKDFLATIKAIFKL